MKKKKIDIRPQHHWICDGFSLETEKSCGKIFFNDDDNVCVYCGSKNTSQLFQCRLKAEIFIY